MEDDLSTQNRDEILMLKVQEFRCIYDKKLKDYKDQRKKANAWKIVGMPVENCMKRYNNIRTQFTKYLRSINPPSGSGRDSVVLKPEYEYLRWLICHIKHRETISNFSNESLHSSDPVYTPVKVNIIQDSQSDRSISVSPIPSLSRSISDEFSEENIEISGIPMQPDKTKLETSMSDTTSPDMLPTTSKQSSLKETYSGRASSKTEQRPWAKKPKCDVSETDKAIMETMAELKATKPVEAKMEDEDSLFCASIAMKMRRFSAYQKGVAQLRILQVLNNVEWSVRPPPTVNQPYTHLSYQSATQLQPDHFQQQGPPQMGQMFQSFPIETNKKKVPEEARYIHKSFSAQLQDAGIS